MSSAPSELGAAEARRRDGPLSIGFLEPHLGRVGGVRRIVELTNRLVDRGYDVSIYVPEHDRARDSWLPYRANVRRIADGLGDRLDVLVFNHEPQWHLLGLFENARARIFYALHYARLYNKAGSWECLRADVDLMLANSNWTAEMIEAEIGTKPRVLLGGVTHEYFHPVETEKRYPVLCPGDRRPWKGTFVIEEAARLLGLRLERYEGKNLPQSAMAEEYCRAEVFAVGSRVEGFGWPGLEALACGVPLVTTDNGGCREYAIDGETALVVPVGDSLAMADAIQRLRTDDRLARRLTQNGLALAREKFDWEEATTQLEISLHEAVARAPDPKSLHRPAQKTQASVPSPEISIVTPTWDNLPYTQDFVESVRRRTDVPYELILVDNGSGWEAANYAREAADVAILNESNLGFGRAMNQGLAAARGRFVAFCNNDTVLPEGWVGRLLAHFDDPGVGIVVPAITKANHNRTVRSEPGETVEVIKPFEPPPPAVIYVMQRETIDALGAWGEEYEVASSEDTDLAFKVWVNGLDIVYDSRVLVQHVGKGTAAAKLDDWERLWQRNRERFFEKWQKPGGRVPYIGYCSQDEFKTRLQIASSVAWWMSRYFKTRDLLRQQQRRGLVARVAPERRDELLRRALRMWHRLKPYLPRRLQDELVARYSGRF